jgi:uncharacterized membrane protein
MLKSLLQCGLSAVLATLADYRRLSIQVVKLEAATCYLRGVRVARESTIGLVRLGLVLGLMGTGLLLVHAGLFIVLPWSLPAKALLAVALGLVYIIVGAIALRVALAEKTWLEKSGALAVLKDVAGPGGE